MPGFEIFGDEERKEVNEVLETGILMRYGFDGARKGRWKTKELEEEIARKMQVSHCHVCASGTGALSIALASCGIGAGDEVIIPPFTFVATVEAVLMAGAIPVFADIDETLCLDPKAVEASVSSRTKAVIPVHMCGAMAKILELKAFCDDKGLILIEDACQSVGATLNGKYLGTFGHMGCFSFDSVKTVTCGEGGAIVTEDGEKYILAHSWSDHGHDHIGNDRGLETHPIAGTNLRISELNAAVGLAQFRKLDSILATQRKHKALIKKGLSDIEGVTFRAIPDEAGDSATFLSFFLPDEETTRKTAKALSEARVDGCFYWYDNNWHYFRQWRHFQTLSSPAKFPLELLPERPDYEKLDLSVSDAIMGRTISMQIKLSWSEEEIAQRTATMTQVLKEQIHA